MSPHAPSPAASSETEDADGRRSRLLRTAVMTNAVNRAMTMVVPLLLVPIGLQALGTSGFGAWAATLAVTSFVAFADLGIGTGLMTRLAAYPWDEGVSAEQAQEARRQVASGYCMVVAVVVTALTALLLSVPVVDWASFLGVRPGSSTSSSDVEWIFVGTMAAFVAGIAANLVVRLYYALGQQGRANLWQAAAAGSALVAAWAAQAAGLPGGYFVAAAGGAPALVMAVCSLHFFTRTEVGRGLRPRRGDVRWEAVAGLAGIGLRFMLISALMSVSLALDPWLVAHVGSLTDAADYAVPMRLFNMIGAVGLMLTVPLWPLHARALAAGDVTWVRSITRKMTALPLLLVLVASVLAIAVGPWFVAQWLGGQVASPRTLWIGLGLLWLAQVAVSATFMVQNGAEVLLPQTVGYVLYVIAALPLKWWVGETHGYAWMPWIGAVLFVLVMWPAALLGYRVSLRRAQSRQPVLQADAGAVPRP